jgi:predicted nucleic acid-binding protein
MRIGTYLDTNCLIALADLEPGRHHKVLALLQDEKRAFIYSQFLTLETLSLALHYRKPNRARIFRRYLNLCQYRSNTLAEIMNEAERQSATYGIVGLDACHIAAAIVGLAREFYTFEKPTKPMFRSKEIKVISLL